GRKKEGCATEGAEHTENAAKRTETIILVGHRKFFPGWPGLLLPWRAVDSTGADEKFRRRVRRRQELLWRRRECQKNRKIELRCRGRPSFGAKRTRYVVPLPEKNRAGWRVGR